MDSLKLAMDGGFTQLTLTNGTDRPLSPGAGCTLLIMPIHFLFYQTNLEPFHPIQRKELMNVNVYNTLLVFSFLPISQNIQLIILEALST